MSNGKESLIQSIKVFLQSEEKCMFITGTNQYKKHIMVMSVLNELMPCSHILFRSSVMQNLMDREFLGRFISKKPQIGQKFRIGNNIYEADTFTNGSSWYKTSNEFDAAIFYPIDAIARGDVNIKCVDNLFNSKEINKIFLISWTDSKYDYSIFDKYIDRKCIYDAEEEDIEYHNRVLEIIDNIKR